LVRNQAVASAASAEMGERHAAAERPTVARSHPVAETHPLVASVKETAVAVRQEVVQSYFLSHSVWELEPRALSDTADKFPSSPLRYRELEWSLCNTGS